MRFSHVCVAVGLLVLNACGGDEAETPSTTPDAADDTSATDTGAAIDSGTAADTTTATDTTAATDTATTTDVATDSPSTCTMTPDAGAKCNELVNAGSDVVLVMTGMAIPTGTGGAVVNGRYVLTEFKSYIGSLLPAGQTLKQTLDICGESGQLVTNDKGKPEVHKSFTIKPTGTAPNLKQTCSTQMPDVEIPYASYTATATTLTFYSTTYQFSATYTKK
jgi:hypothetical protein